MKNLLTICCGCAKIKVEGKWFERDSYLTYDEMVRTHDITDGYCPECVEFYEKEIKERRERNLLKN